MSATDIIIIALAVAGAAYGFIRGVRPALYLLIGLLCSLLAMMFLTLPVENLMLRVSDVDASAYLGAPAVAVFILEGEDVLAYVASLIPLFFMILIMMFFVFGGRVGKRLLTEPGKGVMSRIIGLPVGAICGGILSLIFAAQLIRLPRPMAGSMFRESVLLNALSDVAGYLLPSLAGGLQGV